MERFPSKHQDESLAQKPEQVERFFAREELSDREINQVEELPIIDKAAEAEKDRIEAENVRQNINEIYDQREQEQVVASTIEQTKNTTDQLDRQLDQDIFETPPVQKPNLIDKLKSTVNSAKVNLEYTFTDKKSDIAWVVENLDSLSERKLDKTINNLTKQEAYRYVSIDMKKETPVEVQKKIISYFQLDDLLKVKHNFSPELAKNFSNLQSSFIAMKYGNKEDFSLEQQQDVMALAKGEALQIVRRSDYFDESVWLKHEGDLIKILDQEYGDDLMFYFNKFSKKVQAPYKKVYKENKIYEEARLNDFKKDKQKDQPYFSEELQLKILAEIEPWERLKNAKVFSLAVQEKIISDSNLDDLLKSKYNFSPELAEKINNIRDSLLVMKYGGKERFTIERQQDVMALAKSEALQIVRRSDYFDESVWLKHEGDLIKILDQEYGDDLMFYFNKFSPGARDSYKEEYELYKSKLANRALKKYKTEEYLLNNMLRNTVGENYKDTPEAQNIKTYKKKYLFSGETVQDVRIFSDHMFNALGIDRVEKILMYQSGADKILCKLSEEDKNKNKDEEKDLPKAISWMDYLEKSGLAKNNLDRLIALGIRGFDAKEGRHLASEILALKDQNLELSDTQSQNLIRLLEAENPYKIDSLADLENYDTVVKERLEQNLKSDDLETVRGAAMNLLSFNPRSLEEYDILSGYSEYDNHLTELKNKGIIDESDISVLNMAALIKEAKDVETLRATIDGIKIDVNIDAIGRIIRKINHGVTEAYNEVLFKAEGEPDEIVTCEYTDDTGETSSFDAPVFILNGEPFKMISHSTAGVKYPAITSAIENDPLMWNKIIGSNTISTSFVTSRHNGYKHAGGLIYGFSYLAEGSMLFMGSRNLFVSGSLGLKPTRANKQPMMLPSRLESESDIEGSYNEIVLGRLYGDIAKYGGRTQSNYIIKHVNKVEPYVSYTKSTKSTESTGWGYFNSDISSVDSFIPDVAKRAAAAFKLPIVVINDDAYAK